MPLPRVLVVDDDPEVLETLAWAVGQAGYDAEPHERFDVAKRYIRETPPDALVTDVRLGAFNGLQLAVNLRLVAPTAPVVVVSAFDNPVMRQEAERLGGVFLTKPVTAAALKDALVGLFAAHGG